MVKTVHQIIPNILRIAYGLACTEAYFNGFQYFLYEYIEQNAYIVRSL